MTADGLSRIAAALSMPPIKPDTPHYEAVGRFVTSFAKAEAAVHLLARKLSGLSDAKARIIFGGMRLKDLSDIVRHIVKLDNIEANAMTEIESCLDQLVSIAQKRHNLVHRDTTFVAGILVVSSFFTAKNIDNSESEILNISELAEMHDDCTRIFLRLYRVGYPASETAKTMAATPEALSLLLRPWRYKFVPPMTPNLKPRATPAKQPRQPRASRASRRRDAMARRKES